MGQKSFDFGFNHFFGMTFVVEENQTSDPLHVSFFGAVCVMLGSHYITDLVKKFAGWHRVPDNNRYWNLYGYFAH